MARNGASMAAKAGGSPSSAPSTVASASMVDTQVSLGSRRMRYSLGVAGVKA